MNTLPSPLRQPRQLPLATPAIWLTLAIAAGIALSHTWVMFCADVLPWLCLAIAFAFSVVAACIIRHWAPLALCAVIVGATLDTARWHQFLDCSLPSCPTVYEGIIENLPRHRPRSTVVTVKLTQPYNAVAQITMPTDTSLHKGSHLLFQARMQKVQPAARPYFHYDTWLFHQGIYFRGFANRHQALSTTPKHPTELLLESLRNTTLGSDAEAVAEAMVLGSKNRLSPELRELYNAAGASHLLALSGLHLGIVVVLLMWLFGKSYKWRFLRIACIIPLIWAYVWVTGVPPSLVRAACMVSIMMILDSLNRHVASIDTLTLTVLIMLLWHPFYLFDTGFQLSVVAVAAITLVQPALRNWGIAWRPANRVIGYLYRALLASMAATIATAPIVAATFNRLPLTGWFMSVIYVPLAMPIVIAVMALTALSLLSMPTAWLAVPLTRLLDAQHHIMAMTSLTTGTIHISWPSVLLCHILLLAFIARRRNTMLCSFACLTLCLLAERHYPSTPKTYFENSHATVVHNLSTIHNLPMPDTTFVRQGLYSYGGVTILRADTTLWRYTCRPTPYPIDYLWLCRGFNGHVSDLLRVVAPRHVVLDNSLSAFYRERFTSECDSLGLIRFGLKFCSIQEGE